MAVCKRNVSECNFWWHKCAGKPYVSARKRLPWSETEQSRYGSNVLCLKRWKWDGNIVGYMQRIVCQQQIWIFLYKFECWKYRLWGSIHTRRSKCAASNPYYPYLICMRVKWFRTNEHVTAYVLYTMNDERRTNWIVILLYTSWIIMPDSHFWSNHTIYVCHQIVCTFAHKIETGHRH